MVRVSQVLRSWRCHQEMTQREAAKLIGLPLITVIRIENGAKPQQRTMERIMSWLTEDEIKLPTQLGNKDQNQRVA